MFKRSFFLIMALTMVALVLAACPASAPAGDSGSADDGEMAADMGELVMLRINHRGEPPTADPALSTDTTSSAVIRTLDLGLTRLNPDGKAAEPSLATDWSVDGTTWTFNMRDDVPWVRYDADAGEVVQVTDDSGNPVMVTAQDVEYGIKRTCDAATASDYAYILYIIEGCEAANTSEGSVEDVAVTAVDDTTIEIETTYAATFFPQIISMPVAFAMPQAVIEEHGDLWTEPENRYSNGPFTMSEWIHNDTMTMVRNPFWPGWEEDDRTGNVDVIEGVMIQEASTAFSMYENNELDSVVVPLDLMDTVFGDGSSFGDEGQIYPLNGSYYYGFITEQEAVSDPNVRRALSMAVDRKTLSESVLKGGQIPANTFTNPLNFGSPAEDTDIAPWALSEEQGGPGYAAALEMAQELMAEAGYPDGEGLSLTLGHNVSEANAKIAEAIQAMWTQAFPQIQLNIETQEWGVYLDSIENDAPMEGKPDVFRLGWSADYPHANNWVHEVFNPESGANRIMISADSEQIGDLVAEFTQLTFDAQTAEPEEAKELYKRAEKLLVDDMAVVIPIYYSSGVNVSKPWVDRVYTDDPYWEYWTVDAEAQQ